MTWLLHRQPNGRPQRKAAEHATAAFAEQSFGIKPATFHEDVEADRLPDKLTSPMTESRPS